MSRILAIVSGKGGVGKTTIAINLSLAIHKLGEDVVLVDGNLQNPNVAVQLGLLDYSTTLQDILVRNLNLIEGLHIHSSGLRVIPASISLAYLNIYPTSLRKILEDIGWLTIIDSPPLFTSGTTSILEACDEVLVITTPFLPDITDCMKIIEVAKGMGKNIRGIILNKVRRKEYEIKASEIEYITGIKVFHSIPYDEAVVKSVAHKKPVVELAPFSKASISIFELASKLIDKEYEKPKFLWVRRLFY